MQNLSLAAAELEICGVQAVRVQKFMKDGTKREFAADSAMVWTVENGKAVFQEYTDTEAFANTSIAAAS